MANPFVHVELSTTDVSKAKSFYGALFDWKLEDAEMALKTNLAQNNYQRELLRTTDAGIYDDVYAEIREDRGLYTYKKKKAIELLELQADSFSNKQKGVM